MYVPSIAVLGVLKPRPTSLNHLRPPLPTLLLFAAFDLWLRKMWGCFWYARSDWTVNSVAMIATETIGGAGGRIVVSLMSYVDFVVCQILSALGPAKSWHQKSASTGVARRGLAVPSYLRRQQTRRYSVATDGSSSGFPCNYYRIW